MANEAERDETIAARLAAVRGTIAAAEREAGRPAGSVTLVAVSKFQPAERVDAALDAGQRVFGENRVQEALQRWRPRRAAWPDLQLRLIGPLQTNKARDAVALFDVIETVDRPKLVRSLAEAMAATGRRPVCLVQVNTGEEPQKAGVAPRDLDGLLALARDAGLPLAGLMCIPPAADNPAPHFALLDELAARHGLAQRSMGMSGDFAMAIRHGATHVRVGSAIFGDRPPGPPAG